MERLIQDLKYAIRVLAGSPVFSIVAILTLGLGIGATTAVFSVFNALLQVPFRVGDPDRVVVIRAQNAAQNRQAGASAADFLDWRERNRSFDHMAAGAAVSYNFSTVDEPVWVQGYQFSSGFMPLMGTAPAWGRGFEPDDELPGAEPVTILSHSFWKQTLAGDPKAVGSRIHLDGIPHTVIGVGSEGYFFPQPSTALWTPLPVQAPDSRRAGRNLLVLGRLKEGVTPTGAQEDLEAISSSLAETYPTTNRGWGVTLQTFRESVLAGTRLSLQILYAAIFLILLITCANVGGLLLARAASRTPEMALRTALGAGRRRLFRQLLTESLLLAFLGGCLGLALGVWWMHVLKAMFDVNPQMTALTRYMRLDTEMLLHALGTSIAAGVLFGVVPALQVPKDRLQRVFQQAGRGVQDGADRQRLRGVLVVLQLALALTLLTTTTLLVRSLKDMWSSDPGFETTGLATFQVSLPQTAYATAEQRLQFYESAIERLAVLPGVAGAAVTSRLPAGVFSANPTTPVTIEGAAARERDPAPAILDVTVSPSYLQTLGLDLVAGRDLAATDNRVGVQVAVINQAFATRFWPGADPVGKRFQLGRFDPNAPWITVVGITRDVVDISPNLRQSNQTLPQAFIPVAQRPLRAMNFLVRTSQEAGQLFSAIRSTLRDLDHNQAIFGLLTMDQRVEQQRAGAQTLLRILQALSVLALLLAAVGIYGVISFQVAQGRRSIGIRLALGAQPANVLRMVLTRGALLAATGILLGVAFALGTAQLLKSQLDGLSRTEATDPVTFAGIAALLFLIALAATVIPARKAMRVDPVQTLRSG